MMPETIPEPPNPFLPYLEGYPDLSGEFDAFKVCNDISELLGGCDFVEVVEMIVHHSLRRGFTMTLESCQIYAKDGYCELRTFSEYPQTDQSREVLTR